MISLASDFGQGANGAGRHMQFHTAHVLDLQVDLEFAAASDVGMAASIARCCPASGQLAYTTHNVGS